MASEASNLLESANNHWHVCGDSARATKIAGEIVAKFSDSAEATLAKQLLLEIASGRRNSAQNRTPEQASTGLPARGTIIRDIDVPFLRIVNILLKWGIAAIPATIIILFVIVPIQGLLQFLFK